MTAGSLAFRLALLASAAVAVSSCGDSGSSASSGATPPPAGTNVAAVVVDSGPMVNGTSVGKANQAYVTITVCAPGTTTCQTIDHVWVDTGSTGLRLISSVVTLSLPPSQQGGNNVASCAQFLSSYTWGAMRMVDVTIAGKKAASVPIQMIGDTAGGTIPAPASAPTSCASAGSGVNTVTDMGANGLLGIGVFRQDCGLGCETNTNPIPSGFYYTCPGGTCNPVNMATSLQIQNIVGKFQADNNGVLLQMPALTAAGSLTLSGNYLIFGIQTQSNNALGSAQVFAVDPTTGFINTTTTYGDMNEPASFIDSGSNALFFNDSTIPTTGPGGASCSGFYCPTSAVTRQAKMLPFNSSSPAFTYSFSIVDPASLNANAFNNVGGPAGVCGHFGCTFDWGLPFFYGRSVFTALESTTINGHAGPFFAATTP